MENGTIIPIQLIIKLVHLVFRNIKSEETFIQSPIITINWSKSVLIAFSFRNERVAEAIFHK